MAPALLSLILLFILLKGSQGRERGDHSSLLLWAPNQVHLALLCIYWLPLSSREEKQRKSI